MGASRDSEDTQELEGLVLKGGPRKLPGGRGVDIKEQLCFKGNKKVVYCKATEGDPWLENTVRVTRNGTFHQRRG